MKSCLWTSLLLCIILYIFGMMFAQAVSDHLHETDGEVLGFNSQTEVLRHYFGSLPRSIYTCFKAILGGIDWEVAAEALSDVGDMYVATFVVMICFVYLAVMNVISGIFIQSAIEHAQADINDQIHAVVTEKAKYGKLFRHVFAQMDKDNDGQITLPEFQRSLGSEDSNMQWLFRAMDISTNDAWTLFKLIDGDGTGYLDLEEFVDGCWQLKGNAKSIHMAQLRYELEWLMNAVLELANFCEDSFNRVTVAQDQQRKSVAWTVAQAAGPVARCQEASDSRCPVSGMKLQDVSQRQAKEGVHVISDLEVALQGTADEGSTLGTGVQPADSSQLADSGLSMTPILPVPGDENWARPRGFSPSPNDLP